MGLIVAGAISSMVSASNASVLAASSIGSLMGRRGQASRRFSRIHRDYGTPFWSVTTVTATVVTLILAVITLFPVEGGLTPLELGLTTLTGFAPFNLLAPLSVVNVALIVSRRRYPDIERPVRVPLVPLVPAIGILANLALITSLPPTGILVGVLGIVGLMVAYLGWGGAPESEELFERVVSPYSPTEAADRATFSPGTVNDGATATTADGRKGPEAAAEAGTADDRFRVLVPVARPHRAPALVGLGAWLGDLHEGEPIVQVVNVTHIPDQTPSEMVIDTAEGRADRIADHLSSADINADYTVEGHISRDVAFDVLQTARDDDADLLVMRYPEDNPDIAERIEYNTPCDVVYAAGIIEPGEPGDVTIGTGGGPHHSALLQVVAAMG